MHLHLEESEPLGVEYAEAFFDSFLLLEDSPETFRTVIGLLDEAIIGGEAVRMLRTSRMRVIRTPVGSCARPMRLFFFVEHRTLKFVHIEYYDENHP